MGRHIASGAEEATDTLQGSQAATRDWCGAEGPHEFEQVQCVWEGEEDAYFVHALCDEYVVVLCFRSSWDDELR